MVVMVLQDTSEPGTPKTPGQRQSMRRNSYTEKMRHDAQETIRRNSALAMELDPELIVKRDKASWCISSYIDVLMDQIRKTFQRFDVDKSGFIEKEESYSLMVALYGEAEGGKFSNRLLDSDISGDGKISLSEFQAFVSLQRAQRKLSLAEMIFLTFDNPETSTTAKITSMLIMILILLSSAAFVLETVPAFREIPLHCTEVTLPQTFSKSGDGTYTAHPDMQQPHPGNCPPVPKQWFGTLETVCIAIFTFEYCMRLLTVHAVRDIARRTATVGSDFLVTEDGWSAKRDARSPLMKTWYFAIETMNVIDLVAIMPFYVNLMVSEGGGLAVLRVLRLVRIFRIFKLGKYNSNMQMFGSVIMQSMPALQLLVFFFALGVVLFGSMIYFAEQGSWFGPDMICPGMVAAGQIDVLCRELGFTEGVYLRSNLLGNGKEVTPFDSIVKAFWWVATTATTVGYGDLYPTSWPGKFVAILCMLAGILVMALPITVLGFNFHNEYAILQAEKLGFDEEDANNIDTKVEVPTSVTPRDSPREMPKKSSSTKGQKSSGPLTSITRTNSIERERPSLVVTDWRSSSASVGSSRIVPVSDSPSDKGAGSLKLLVAAASKLGPRALPNAKTVFSEQQISTLAEDAANILVASAKNSIDSEFQSFFVHVITGAQMGMCRLRKSSTGDKVCGEIIDDFHLFHKRLLEFGLECIDK